MGWEREGEKKRKKEKSVGKKGGKKKKGKKREGEKNEKFPPQEMNPLSFTHNPSLLFKILDPALHSALHINMFKGTEILPI